MKTIFVFLLLISTICLAQENKFFPLKVGNIWKFEEISTIDETTDTLNASLPVLKDTTISDKIYYKVQFPSYFVDPEYLRFDSTLNSIMNYVFFDSSESTFLDFNLTEDESSNGVKCIEDDTIEVFGSPKHVKGYLFGDIPSFSISLAEDLGPIYMIDDESWAHTVVLDYCIRYAYVNGKEYGDTLTSINQNRLPSVISLSQNYPNPFNSETVINYWLSEANHVEIKIYDLSGRVISTLIDRYQNIGEHLVVFRADGLASGIYVYKIRIGSFEQSRKMILIK